MYFVTEMTESCLDLAWFILWNDHTPLEAWFLDGKNIMVCVTGSGWCLHLREYKHWFPSEVTTSVAKMDWAAWLVAWGASQKQAGGRCSCLQFSSGDLSSRNTQAEDSEWGEPSTIELGRQLLNCGWAFWEADAQWGWAFRT